MTTPKHVSDFPADTQWIQLPKGAIAVLPDGRVFRMAGAVVEELQARETEAKASIEPAE